MNNNNQQLYLNIRYNLPSKQFEYDVDNYTWFDPVPYDHKPYLRTSDKYKLKIWLDLNGLKLHNNRNIVHDSLFSLRSYSLIKK